MIRKTTRILIVTMAVGLLCSCDQELQISANGDTIPVVYALINPDDTVHTIRISHSFKGNGDATVLAQNPDSICYDTLSPKIEFYTSSGWKYHEIRFFPVVDNFREEGYFSNQGVQLYQHQGDISVWFIQGTRLVLNIPIEQGNVTAIAEYVDPPKIWAPKQGIHTYLDFYPYPLEVVFEDPPEFSRYELHVLMYIENIMQNGDTVFQTIDKTFLRNSENPGTPRAYNHLTVLVSGDLLLAQVRQEVKTDPAVAFRQFDRVELVLRTGSPDFYEYLDLNSVSNDYGGSAITNITGGIGIFALKYQRRVTNIFPGPVTMDSLLHGRFTRTLKFKDW